MNRLKILGVICLGFLAIFNEYSSAQTVTKLLKSGTTANKKDLVIIGDGFRAGADQTIYNNFVNNFVISGVFAEGPLWEDMNAFNIYRINAISADSGVTQVDTLGNVTVARNTALDYRYSGDWDRCWMEPGPNTYSNLTTILNNKVPGYDYVFIVLNEVGFGGCGGGGQLAVTLGGNWTVGAHESGHMIGLLADEYCGNQTYTWVESAAINLTINTDRATLKWRDFVNPSTPIPTGINPNPGNGGCTGYNQGPIPAGWSDSDDAGLFEGAQYCNTGIYRPVVNCRMRGNSPPFCPVCYNQIKNLLDPYHEYTYDQSLVGDFTGDGKDDVVIHNANGLALYQSVGDEIEPVWIATGEILVWDDFMKGDRFYVGDFDGDGKDDLFVFNSTDWAMPYFGLLHSTGSGFECVRLYGLELPGWDDMKTHDQFYVTDFNGDNKDDILVFNGRDWSMGYLVMLRSTGTGLQYIRRYDRNLPGWGEMRKNDEFYVANFDNDRNDDLYVFNGYDWSIGYLQMLRSDGLSFQHVRRYDNELPGWDDMKPHDDFFVADFDRDGREDLYAFNGPDWSMSYLEMLKSTGTSLACTRRFDGTAPGWDGLEPHDKFFVADVNSDRRSDLYVYNSSDWATEYLGMLRSTGNNLTGGWQANWIGSWNLGSADRFLVGNFNGDKNYEDLLVRNDDWFGLLRSYSSSLQLTAIYPKWIHRHRYHWLGWW